MGQKLCLDELPGKRNIGDRNGNRRQREERESVTITSPCCRISETSNLLQELKFDQNALIILLCTKP
jgi:hypothetical protein